MKIVDFGKFKKSLSYAWKGWKYAFEREQSFRIQVGVSCVVIALMILFQVAIWEMIVLLLVIAAVLILELINTIFEAIIDVIKPRMHHYVEIIKDIMAGAVLLASLFAAIIGVIILGPYILRLFI